MNIRPATHQRTGHGTPQEEDLGPHPKTLFDTCHERRTDYCVVPSTLVLYGI